MLYVQMIRALYGMLTSAVLFYKKLRKDLETIGFQINLYDVNVANRIVEGTQHTVIWHVDDIKSSHMLPAVNEKFLKWLQDTYAKDEIGKVKYTRDKIHKYLGITLDFRFKNKLRI